MSAPKLAIVADDLTGAADSAARCAQAGLTAVILLEFTPQDATVDVVAISTDSRYLPPDEAHERVAAQVAALEAWREASWYKKIDSTLRGNLGAEIDALLAARPAAIAVICPAFPAQGRGLEGGYLVYPGAPAHHLPTLLSAQSQLAVAEVGLATVRTGEDALRRALHSAATQGKRLIAVDAMTDADLATIVAATDEPDYLLCGSAGLVAPLAARLAQAPAIVAAPAQVPSGPILTLVGSGSPVARAQVAQVAAAGAMRVRTLDGGWYAMDLTGAQCHPVGDWLLNLAPPAPDMSLEGAVARAQAARLADVAFAAVERLQPSAIIVVGGDTANFVLRRLGIRQLTVSEELLPGIALSFGTDRFGQQRAVVLKPGNFGDAETLVTLQRAVHARQG